MATAGVDYKLTAIPRAKTIARFREDLVQCACSIEYGLTYQKCRFCGRGWPELPHLLKYAVRHYVCEDCRRYWTSEKGGRS